MNGALGFSEGLTNSRLHCRVVKTLRGGIAYSSGSQTVRRDALGGGKETGKKKMKKLRFQIFFVRTN
jgi:hypothetical protein